MNTFLLTWNPTVDRYRQEYFVEDLQSVHNGDDVNRRWRLENLRHASKGDRFYMIRTGHANSGICMVGCFFNTPFQHEDGSGLCTNLEPQTLIDCDIAPMVSLEQLKELLPDVRWNDLGRGQLLTEEEAFRLDMLWLNYLYEHQDMYDGVAAAQAWDFDIESWEAVTPTMQKFLLRTRGNKCEKCGRSEEEVTEMAYHLVLDGDYDPETPLESHLHCYCSECWF